MLLENTQRFLTVSTDFPTAFAQYSTAFDAHLAAMFGICAYGSIQLDTLAILQASSATHANHANFAHHLTRFAHHSITEAMSDISHIGSSVIVLANASGDQYLCFTKSPTIFNVSSLLSMAFITFAITPHSLFALSNARSTCSSEYHIRFAASFPRATHAHARILPSQTAVLTGCTIMFAVSATTFAVDVGMFPIIFAAFGADQLCSNRGLTIYCSHAHIFPGIHLIPQTGEMPLCGYCW